MLQALLFKLVAVQSYFGHKPLCGLQSNQPTVISTLYS